VPASEHIRDYCTEYMKVKRANGAFSEFKLGYLHMVIDHLNDARMIERRAVAGLTGRDPYWDDTH
jgi:hypothetical protein